ncbi:MAG: response regulator [Clostridia bacterium]|nr:response regulator [Clostridia bacterium]
MELSETTKKWQKLSKRVLLIGVAVGLAVCIAMFIVLGVYTNRKSKETINGVGETFMAGIGSQMVMRYNQIIEQRATMVEALHTTYSSESPTVNEDMIFAAKNRGFDYLALMGEDGHLEMLLGDKVVLEEPDPFIKSLNEDKVNKFAIATSYDGDTVLESGIVLIGVPTTPEGDDSRDKPYILADGVSESTALVAGMKNTILSNMLAETNTDGSAAKRFDTHIIRSNGKYVLHPNDHDNETHTQYADYFEQIRNGFGMDAEEAESLIDTLKTRMSTEKVFSAVVNTSTPRRHIYCGKMENSEWFLITVMKYTDLDAQVTDLSKSLTGVTVGICAVIIVILVAVFAIYLFLNRRNLQQVEHSRELAEEANRAKSDFLSNMSHDIRTPMNAIVGMTAIATANIDDQQKVADCLKKITLSSRHLLGLINDVLDMSKIESGKMTLNMEQISLSEVIEGISTIIQPQLKIKRQHFDIYVKNILAESVYCDSVRLNQVLLNLLSNAYKFTPEEGTIELSVYQEESPRGNDFVRTHIVVQDNGIGMSEEFQKHIFESFTREDSARVNKTEGTGLGMSITKYIVDAMRGKIDVFSKLGKGTTFHITLDLEKAEIAEVDMILPKWRMLVVDDDQMLCDTAVAALSSIGVEAESTLDGESAVKMAMQARAANKSYDIILIDWKLPGIDGIETARRMHKKLDKDLPIMLISAYDWTEIEDEARAAGISGFIAKPLFKSTLFYGLRQFTQPGSDAPVKVETKSKEVNLEGKRVLVAEDNDLNWEIAELLLSGAGLIVEHAENGQVCVDKLLEHKPGYYDAILMDVRMPVMNGLEAAEYIRGLRKGYNKVPIIAMTADAFAEDMQKCLDCGMNAHIAKPIEIDVVKATLAKFIEE